ncbi:MAG: tRNA uridine(34) 5-carboxymethylaminomethyl modification radical SAM/GNAT enzyme Elp3 [Candidatus Nanoarchaeia archaeon]
MQKKEELKKFAKEILKSNLVDRNKIETLKLRFAEKFGRIPLNSELLATLEDGEREELRKILKTKPTRTLSGVAVISVMTAPFGCPGKCIYCPTVSNVPKSYTGAEPSTLRGSLCEWDPFKIVSARLKQLAAIGHSIEKCEIIVQGGTWTALPKKYRENFIKKIFDACNGFESKDLENAQKANEVAKSRIVGLTFETRPDYCSKKDVKDMLKLGATRVELGLQSVYDDVLKKIKRGHDLKCAKEAIKRLKNFGLKVDLHVMLGLPGTTKQKDIEMFRILFEDADLRPDGLKIYPTAVLPNTELYEMWKKGEYKAINDEYILDVLTEAKSKYIPEYCRIKRIMRDIPTSKIVAGYTHPNLREYIRKKMENENKKCRCIRCREIGQKYKYENKLPKRQDLIIRSYDASGGKEFFISFEDSEQDILLGFIRLRLCDKAFIRELHIYGEAAPLDMNAKLTEVAIQHKGLGKRLLQEAEKIAKENGYKMLYVTSGVGVRKYYASQGYVFKSPYMLKNLNKR